jgi:pimeloyl-ACP methyl ester carboxylesterase
MHSPEKLIHKRGGSGFVPIGQGGRSIDSMGYAKTINIEYNSIPIKVLYNSVGEGPSLLFLHGWNHLGLIWDPVVKRIGGSYRCITLDLPGFGNSQPIPSSMVSIESYAGICTKVMEQLPDSVPLSGIIGDSFGALIALEMMNCHGMSGKSLLLSGCPFEGLGPILRASAIVPAFSLGLRILRMLPLSISRSAVRYLCLATVRRLQDVSEALIDGVLLADPSTSQSVFETMLELKDKRIVRPPGAQRVLVIRGQHDWIVSRNTAIRSAQKMNGEYREIAGVGHTPMLEDPYSYAESVTSLAKQVRS